MQCSSGDSEPRVAEIQLTAGLFFRTRFAQSHPVALAAPLLLAIKTLYMDMLVWLEGPKKNAGTA